MQNLQEIQKNVKKRTGKSITENTLKIPLNIRKLSDTFINNPNNALNK